MTGDGPINTDARPEIALLVGVDNEKSLIGADDSLDELRDLAETAGAVTAGRLTQKREGAHPSHYLGKGKIDELKDMIAETGANMIICDDELSSAQMRNLSDALGVKTLDRALLILDIFAARAASAEGAVQVELARLKYDLSHLTGLGKSLSRLGGGGGIGARRGSGESKLELDRRRIRARIADLTRETAEIRKRRGVSRIKREKNAVPVVAMTGYTNSGKSTIMNLVTNAGVLAEDKLFATLDTTLRRAALPGGSEILLADTVGFINKLPHQLIEAFKATLEELRFADVLLHIVDASDKTRDERMAVVYETLKSLDCSAPVVTVFNKTDLEHSRPLPRDRRAETIVEMSAATGEGLAGLLETTENTLKSLRVRMTVFIPYSDSSVIGAIRGNCEIASQTYDENGTTIELYARGEMRGRLKKYAAAT
jgi:GTP-binding protein HflX